ncbi:MAG: hypothetical protein JO143_06675 [Acetobacteraceae bacterium]|nr:hypothetical protein [Acetobacteraceae bacterium]
MGLDAASAAARTVSGFARAVAGVVNDGARVVGAVDGIGAVVTGGYNGRHVSGRRPATPLVAINQAGSFAGRTDAAVLARASSASRPRFNGNNASGAHACRPPPTSSPLA